MKTKHIIIVILCLGFSLKMEAQLLNKLKKKAEEAAERTILNKTDEVVSEKTEEAIDGITKGETDNPSNENPNTNNTPKATKFSNPSLAINTEAKKAHYIEDVRVVSFDKEKQSEMVSYFDADAVAMQSNWVDTTSGEKKTSFMDSEGFFISYNDTERCYTKNALMSTPVMGMMAPSMMASAYKLPVNAIYGALEEMQNKGLKVYPFMHVDFPFVLKPEFYRDEMVESTYKETKQSCRGTMGCTKFSVLESGYEGSYSLFDNQDRLVEINIIVKDDPNFGSGKGKIEYFYEPCEVNVPDAVEKKMPGQDLFNMGLDPNKN